MTFADREKRTPDGVLGVHGYLPTVPVNDIVPEAYVLCLGRRNTKILEAESKHCLKGVVLFLDEDTDINIDVLTRVKDYIRDRKAATLFWGIHNRTVHRFTTGVIIQSESAVMVHETAVVGAEGMGFFVDHLAVPHRIIHGGCVVLRYGVEVGPNTVVHRAIFPRQNTVIGPNVKIGAGNTIGHGCVVGARTIITAGVTVGGSVRVGRDCFLGAGSTIRDNIRICDGVMIGAGAVIIGDITNSGVYVGNPGRWVKEWDGDWKKYDN